MNKLWDLIIIGAGPAGMASAVEAASHNLSVLVLDRQERPGGQIFRSAGEASVEKIKSLGADYAKGRKLIEAFQASKAEFAGGSES